MGISRHLVNRLLQQGIEHEKVPSYMEDKAIGIWIDQWSFWSKLQITWIDLPGSNGYGEDFCSFMRGRSVWGNYKLILHHHLSPSNVRCMGLQHAADSNDFSCCCT